LLLPVRDTKVFNPIDLKITIDDRHGIASHLGRTALVPNGTHGIPYDLLERRSF
jgi:hypothetical protein